MNGALRSRLVAVAISCCAASESGAQALHPFDGEWLAVFDSPALHQTLHAHVTIAGREGRWRTLVRFTAQQEGCTGNAAPIRVRSFTQDRIAFLIDYDSVVQGCGMPLVVLTRKGEELVGQREGVPVVLRRR